MSEMQRIQSFLRQTCKLTDKQKANLSQEIIAKAMQCETPEQLVELAKSEGIDLTLEEAQAYLDEMDDVELDCQQLKSIEYGYVGVFVKCLPVLIKILHTANRTQKEKCIVLYSRRLVHSF